MALWQKSKGDKLIAPFSEGVHIPHSKAGIFIILWTVRWYCKYGNSYREPQEMLAERGVNVDHTKIYRWVQRYAPEMKKRLRGY
jgi:hypothetical protein